MTSQEIILSLVQLLGGLGSFLIAFKLVSENIEKLANAGLKKLFNKISKNRFVGVGIGAMITALIQSSAATTVMIVGFVNAGVIDLFQATSMIMGANIGTTITAQIVALGAADISVYASIFACIGMFMSIIFKNEKIKSLGLFFAGFGLLFIALAMMKESMQGFANNEGFRNVLASINNPFLLIIAGAIITMLLQSSAAVTTILISMVAAGITIGNSSNAILFVILGTNIGTCLTALVSSIGANVNARRASLIHLLFNVFGTVIFMIILLMWKDFKADTLDVWFVRDETRIAMFHTIFNVASTCVFLPVINGFVKISELLVRDRRIDQKTTFLDERFIKTPSIAVNQIIKETDHLGQLAMNTLDLALTKFIEKDLSFENEIRDSIAEIDTLNKDILTYLVKVSAQDVALSDERLISAIHNSLNDFIREAEIADNVIKYTHSVIEKDIIFSESVYDSIRELQKLLKKQYKNIQAIMLAQDFSVMDSVNDIESTIDTMRSSLISGHIKRLEEGKCKPQSSGVFINLVSNLERAGDHLEYIANCMIDGFKGN